MTPDRFRSILFLRCAAFAAVLVAGSLRAQPPAVSQSPTGTTDAVVQLPPMLVEESSKGPPWLYAAAGDSEYLSHCSTGVTHDYIRAHLTVYARLRTIVPDEFLAKTSVLHVSILVPPSATPGGDDAVFREMMKAEQEYQRNRATKALVEGRVPAATRFEFMPNMRLDDRDMMGVYTVLDPTTFDGGRLVQASGYVHQQLTRCTPMLPQWLIEGIVGLYEQTDLRAPQVTFRPLLWMTREDTEALVRDPESRRVLLPPVDLFAPDALLGEGNKHPLRAAAWRAQTALFVRWALDPANAGMREALWRLASRVSREPMTEKLFTECFGFGYVDLLDRLSDYLPVAVKTPVALPAVPLPPPPRYELKPATPAQIARLRGEWERLEISSVRESHPQFVAHYARQARQSFSRGASPGQEDPLLIAAAALCELDAGNPVAALPLLEKAAAAHIVRPRLYFELAKLRWLALIKDVPSSQRFSVAQLQPILAPLREALGQTPLLPEVLLLTTDVWLRSEEPISSLELETLSAFAPRLRRYSTVGLQLAYLHAILGRQAEASAMLGAAFPFVTDPAVRVRYQQLHAALAKK